MHHVALAALLLAPLPAAAAPTYACSGQQSQVCNLAEGSCRLANAPGTAIEVDPGARRMRHTQNGREWDLVHVETGRGAEVFALTAQGSIISIGAGPNGTYVGTFSSVTFPNASIGLITCAKK